MLPESYEFPDDIPRSDRADWLWAVLEPVLVAWGDEDGDEDDQHKAFTYVIALYWHCAHWYNGQWCGRYSILSQLTGEHRLVVRGAEPDEDTDPDDPDCEDSTMVEVYHWLSRE